MRVLDDQPAPPSAGDVADNTTEAGELDETAIAPHDAQVTDPADLGGESPCFAHLLDELPF